MQKFHNIPKFIEAWRTQTITGPARCKTSTALLTADPNTIWFGDHALPVVRRNVPNNIVVRVRSKMICTGSAGVNAITHACDCPAVVSRFWEVDSSGKGKWNTTETKPAHCPYPYVRVDSCAPAILNSCDLATLQTYVLDSAREPLLQLAKLYKKTKGHDRYRIYRLDKSLEEETKNLANAGLVVPDDLADAIRAAKAAARLTT